MAISTYAELKDAAQNFLAGRTDLANRIDDFLALCHADINSTPDFRLRDMETTATLTLASSSVALPSDYLEWRQVTSLDNPRRPLDFIPPSTVEKWYADRAAAPANSFTITGSTIYVYPLSTTQISMVYYASVPVLSASATTNWLLTKQPAIYLFGILAKSALFTMDTDGMGDRYQQQYSGAMQALIAADRGARYARTQRRSGEIRP